MAHHFPGYRLLSNVTHLIRDRVRVRVRVRVTTRVRVRVRIRVRVRAYFHTHTHADCLACGSLRLGGRSG